MTRRVGRQAAALTGLLLLAGCGGGTTPSPTVATPSPSAVTPTPAPTAAPPGSPITLGRGPDGMAFGEGSIWTANFTSGTVTRVDPIARRATATISVGSNPLAVDAEPGAVWVANFGDDTVSRIDPANNRVVATIAAVQKPTGLAVAGTSLWVFGQGRSGGASVIDMTSNAVVRTVPLTIAAGFATAQLGRLWVPDFQGSSHSVIAVDPATDRVVVRVAVGTEPVAVGVGPTAGWVANYGSDSVTRFNPATGAATATLPVPGGTPNELLIAGDTLFVTSIGGNQVVKIDTRTNAVTGTIAVGNGPRDVLIVGQQLFVDDFDDGDLRTVPLSG